MTERDVFIAALQQDDPAQRRAYLDEACARQPELRRQVEDLLRLHERAGSFLQTPAGSASTEAFHDTSDERPSAELPGTMIGPYKLVEPIGEGGMGTVWLAEQTEPVQRLVALKLIKAGMGSRQVVARFEAERQALALMDHPNIARVLDAGTTGTGRPFFVMDLVKGVAITTYCDEHRLTPRERLELFIPVCQAVQHAHQKGVIHRDLKPANVLVAEIDGRPVPKVIDFGVAKAAGPALTDQALATGFGAIVGTLEYMSPEQAELDALDVDTRSDIYALGVLLYELLAGSPPFTRREAEKTGMLGLLRLIREQEPPRPSTRLGAAEGLRTLAANRGTEPTRLTRLVRGELDWIVMKALEKDRDRRYDTATAFAADVRRYLADEPVQACPPSVGYRLRKFAWRNRGPVLAASLVLLALVGGVIGATWGLIRADEARAEAVREADEKRTALAHAKDSKRDALERLFDSYLEQARANRLSRRPGQRFATLAIVTKAARLARELDLPDDRFDAIRNAAIAALALPDLYPAGPGLAWPADGYGFDFDAAYALYARTDRKGNCSVRRVRDDAELHRLPGLGGPAEPEFSRDGKFLAVRHYSARDLPAVAGVAVEVWDLRQDAARKIRAEAKARFVDFHADDRQIALAYNDGTIAVYELPGGRQLGPTLAATLLTREVAIALHPTEPVVAVCSYFAPLVQLRDLRTGEITASLPQQAGATHVAWRPDGQALALGFGANGRIHLVDRSTLAPYRTLHGGQGGTYLTFNHAGDRLATRGWGGTAELFDVATGQKLFATPGGGRRFRGDDQRLAGTFQDGKLVVWQVGDGREYRTLARQASPQSDYLAVALHPGGRLLAAGTEGGFGLWDLATGDELAFAPLDAPSTGVHALCFDLSGALLTGSASGLRRWPVRADAQAPGKLSLGPPERLLARAGCIAQSEDGRVLVAANRAVGRWQAHAGGWIRHADEPDRPLRLDPGADISGIAVSPDGRWVVTSVFNTGLTKVWDARDGALVKQLAEWGPHRPRFSADSRWLSMGGGEGDGFAVGSWEPRRQPAAAGVSAPGGRILAADPTGAGTPLAGVTRLVDRATGREFARLEDPDSPPTHLRFFTPDGGRLIDVGNGRVKGIRVWDLRLLRQQLKDRGLEGRWPEDASPDPPPAGPPLVVQILGAELGK